MRHRPISPDPPIQCPITSKDGGWRIRAFSVVICKRRRNYGTPIGSADSRATDRAAIGVGDLHNFALPIVRRRID